MPDIDRTRYSRLKPMINKIIRMFTRDCVKRINSYATLSEDEIIDIIYDLCQAYELQLDVELGCEYVLPDISLEFIPIDLACELNNRSDLMEVKK